MNWRDPVGSRVFRRLFTKEMMIDSLDEGDDERWRYLKTYLIRIGNWRLSKGVKCF